MGAARARHRSDVEQGRQAEADVVETTEYLEHASHLAMASLLRVICFFCCCSNCKPPGGAMPACRWSCAPSLRTTVLLVRLYVKCFQKCAEHQERCYCYLIDTSTQQHLPNTTYPIPQL